MLKVQSRMYRVRIMRENQYSEIHSKSFLEGHGLMYHSYCEKFNISSDCNSALSMTKIHTLIYSKICKTNCTCSGHISVSICVLGSEALYCYSYIIYIVTEIFLYACLHSVYSQATKSAKVLSNSI